MQLAMNTSEFVTTTALIMGIATLMAVLVLTGVVTLFVVTWMNERADLWRKQAQEIAMVQEERAADTVAQPAGNYPTYSELDHIDPTDGIIPDVYDPLFNGVGETGVGVWSDGDISQVEYPDGGLIPGPGVPTMLGDGRYMIDGQIFTKGRTTT